MKTVFKIMHYNDVHLQDNNPPSRLGSYKADILAKLAYIFKVSKEHKVDCTVCGGDLFNPKKPGSITHALVREVAEVLVGTGVTNFIVPGNHDMQYDSMDTLDEQPLGVLMETGVLRQMDTQVLSKGDLSVKFWSHAFDETPDLGAMKLTSREDVDVHVLGIHVYASSKGGKLHTTKVYSYAEIGSTDHDLYLFGHYHADNGVVRNKDGQVFVNVGSVSRGDYGDENLNRQPNCCLITITKDNNKITVETLVIPIECKASTEVFDLEKKEKLAKQKVDTEAFVQELQLASEQTEGTLPIAEELKELATDKEIYDMAMEYLQKGEESLVLGKKK